MAEITVKGYVNKPATKESVKGPFATFTLAEQQKGRNGEKKKVYYDCVDFNNPAPPESSFVTLTGWLSEKDFQRKDGSPGKGWSINVQKIEVAPPREGQGWTPAIAPPPEDPFDLTK